MKSKRNLNPTIGMETHVELSTNSKMFCGCPANHFGKPPNTQTCPVCLALPGALPVPNRRAVEWTIMLGLSLNCKINNNSKFDRKHYFYPDLPKGYQISQYDEPICVNGYLNTKEGKIRITRVHLEEDTGKLQHRVVDGKKVTLVDFNRSGVPLVEIVTEPDIHSGTQAKEYTQKLQNIIRYLEISDCDMEKGSMRLEANVSWGEHLDYKVEVKNLNSFKFVDKAINYELDRQKRLIEKGNTPKQETRGWDEKENKTVHQRYKEVASDYRYFPEPDIPPMKFSKTLIQSIKNQIPELPDEKYEYFIDKLNIRNDYAEIIIQNKEMAIYTEKILGIGKKQNINSDDIINYLINKKVDPSKNNVNEVLDKISKSTVKLISDKKLLSEWIDEAIKKNEKAVNDYKNGKENALFAIVGMVMKLSLGKADPKITKKLLKKALKKY